VPKPKRSVEIRINEQWCKRCGICIAFCPTKVYTEKMGLPIISNIGECTGCMLCEHLCPDFAIEVEVKKEAKKEEDRGSSPQE